MSILTEWRTPGTGRRQADPLARALAELQREREARQRAQAELRHTASVLGEFVVMLGDEQAAHQQTREERDRAVRANRCNAEAETVQTDVTALRAAVADEYVEPERVPQYQPYRRIPSPTIRVVPLWASPQAAGPTNVPIAGGR